MAFQAIVNIHTGQCLGYDILVRAGGEDMTIPDFFNTWQTSGSTSELELAIRSQAAKRAAMLPPMRHRLLFLNLGHRLGIGFERVVQESRRQLARRADRLVVEVNGHPGGGSPTAGWISKLRAMDVMVAVGRFGAGSENLLLQQDADPDFVKVDRAFIRDVDVVPRKRILLSQLVGTAHTLGLKVIAVGIETAGELTVCREIGCDLAQGNFIQSPVLDPHEAGTQFPHVEELARQDRSRRRIDHRWIADQLDPIPPVVIDTAMTEIFARVANNPNQSLIPVVDHIGQPLGVLRERNLKNFAYSAFGKDLIANRSLGRNLGSFLVRCPIADVTTPLDQLLAIYSAEEDADGILITEQMHYRGFLSARSIIRAIHEKTLARARDENPLTKLPGNSQINDYIAELTCGGKGGVLAYIDFDNFKPFNDTYGFRQGDRAILLFAELMRKSAKQDGWFLGHIGGDDFFIGLEGMVGTEATPLIASLIAQFGRDAESFYDAEARRRGHIVAADREGNQKCFPLLTASAVLVEVRGNARCSVDDISTVMARHKKAAKTSPVKLAITTLESAEACGEAASSSLQQPCR